MTTRYTALANVNLRTGPGTGRTVIRLMPIGTAVQLLDGLQWTADSYAWQGVMLTDHTVGWCVSIYKGQSVFTEAPPPPPAPTAKHKIGFHNIGNTLDIRPLLQRLLDNGTPVAGVTQINENKIVPDLARLVGPSGCVIVRNEVGNTSYPDTVEVSDDPTAAYQQGVEAYNHRALLYEDVPNLPNVWIQILNEQRERRGDVYFWRGVMDACGTRHKLALMAFSYGTPADDQHVDADKTYFRTLYPMLTVAKQRGHILCLHTGTDESVAPGQLGDANQRSNYEVRFKRWYDDPAMPESAKLRIAFGEAYAGTPVAIYTGPENLVNWTRKYNTLVMPEKWVISFHLWTLNGDYNQEWKKSNINPAISEVETLCRGYL